MLAFVRLALVSLALVRFGYLYLVKKLSFSPLQGPLLDPKNQDNIVNLHIVLGRPTKIRIFVILKEWYERTKKR
jgi:hypothetical protein